MKKNFGCITGAVMVVMGLVIAVMLMEQPVWLAMCGFLLGLLIAGIGFGLMFDNRDCELMHKFDSDNYRDMEE